MFPKKEKDFLSPKKKKAFQSLRDRLNGGKASKVKKLVTMPVPQTPFPQTMFPQNPQNDGSQNNVSPRGLFPE
jgi:hypothetical protein